MSKEQNFAVFTDVLCIQVFFSYNLLVKYVIKLQNKTTHLHEKQFNTYLYIL